MTIGLSDILSTLQNGVTAIRSLNTVLGNIFPQATATSTSATLGAAALPASPEGFIVVNLSSGIAVKVPYYNT